MRDAAAGIAWLVLAPQWLLQQGSGCDSRRHRGQVRSTIKVSG